MVFPTDVRIEHDVAYLPAGREEKADLYFPLTMPQDRLLAAVIIIHGGGFNEGDKGRPREISIGRTLALHGYVGMSINYKLAKTKGVATWPQPVYDAKAAVRWLRMNSARLGLDPERIAVIGCSAGGNLAAMLALTGPADEFDAASPYPAVPAAVRCAIDFYGVIELLDYHDMKMFARSRTEAPELYRRGSPNRYADAHDAPMLIVHGTADETVKVAHSELLAAALAQAGVEHQLVLLPGAPHTFDLEPKQRDLRPLVLEFLDKHLPPPVTGK
ncbi:MAG: alpha/beta hydrolase [Lacunisphaera sp.]|nr:alpha/beta hydrolase [Lacunisphaera sp.]